jgi:hypothetical protein
VGKEHKKRGNGKEAKINQEKENGEREAKNEKKKEWKKGKNQVQRNRNGEK